MNDNNDENHHHHHHHHHRNGCAFLPNRTQPRHCTALLDNNNNNIICRTINYRSMQGRGVTNFSVDKPSHQYTTRTTEFDDALIQRGIVTLEQAMTAKGATEEEAVRLANEQRTKKSSLVEFDAAGNNNNDNNETANDDSDDDDDDSFEDDDFLQRYRQERLKELQQEAATISQQQHQNSQTVVRHIVRDEWKDTVNEASMDRWVIVTMVEASGERKDRVVQELHKISREFLAESNNNNSNSSDTRLLTIDAEQAIPNWPAERVPAMFAYRNGVKQHEWIATRRGEFPSRDLLEDLFRRWDVI